MYGNTVRAARRSRTPLDSFGNMRKHELRKCFGCGNYCKHNLKHQRRAIKQRIPRAAKSATNYAAVRRVKYGSAGVMQYNLKLEHRILHENNTIPLPVIHLQYRKSRVLR